MAAALVKFVQGASIGTPGVALIGVDGTSVTVSNGASNVGIITWTFTVISVPSNSSVPLGVAQTGATTTWVFTPDVAGCFVIEVTTTDGSANMASDVRAFGVLTTAGLLIPAFTGDNNSMNFGGQLTGWDVYMEAWLRQLETLLDGSFAGATPISKATSFTAVAGATYLITATPLTITMPTMTLGQKVKIIDYVQTTANGYTPPSTWPNALTIAPPSGWKIQDPNTQLYGATSASVLFHENGAGVEWASDGTSKLYING